MILFPVQVRMLMDLKQTLKHLRRIIHADDVSPEMKEFLDWMAGNGSRNTEFIRELSRAVQKVRNHEEWRMEYMTLLMRNKKMREEEQVGYN